MALDFTVKPNVRSKLFLYNKDITLFVKVNTTRKNSSGSLRQEVACEKSRDRNKIPNQIGRYKKKRKKTRIQLRVIVVNLLKESKERDQKAWCEE